MVKNGGIGYWEETGGIFSDGRDRRDEVCLVLDFQSLFFGLAYGSIGHRAQRSCLPKLYVGNSEAKEAFA